MGQFLHIHPGGAGEGEEADPAQDGRNKYSGKISTLQTVDAVLQNT